MSAKGFHIGDVVKHRKSDAWSLFKIKDIGENIDLNPFDTWDGTLNQSELKQITSETFIKEWQHSSKQIEELSGTYINGEALEPVVVKNMLTCCMTGLLKQENASVRIFKAPESSVCSAAKYEEQALCIVPVTKTITTSDAQSAWKDVLATCEGHRFKLQSQQDSKCMATFWYLDIKTDRSKCNLELIDKTFYTKRPLHKTPNANAIVNVVIPVAVNFKAFGDRERLVLYRPAGPKPEDNKKREAPLVLASGAKKTKEK